MHCLTKSQAEKILGLSGSYDYKQFIRAYRVAVKLHHPDVGGTDEEMALVNEAKEYLETYFLDDENVVVECSPQSDFGNQGESASHDDDASNGSSWSKADWDNFWAAAEEGLFSDDASNDAPFTDCEYTSKPQAQWAQEDWQAFMSFMPPRSFKDKPEFWESKKKSWNPVYISQPKKNPHTGLYEEEKRSTGCAVDASLISVESWGALNRPWTDDEWYYYWFTNARYPREDGLKRVRYEPRYIYGPEAERQAAKHTSRYWETSQKYRGAAKDDWVNTPYGRVSILSPGGYHTAARSGWVGNVGAPFAYALCEDYDLWLEMNLAAQKEAIGARDITPVASHYGWTGLEFLRPEDRDVAWVRDMGLFVPKIDCSIYPSAPEAIGIWELHPENPALTHHAKIDLPDHKALNEKTRRHMRRGPVGRFVERHQKGLGWLFVFLVYETSVRIASAGFESGAFGIPVAFAIEIAATVVAIIFRKKVIGALIR